MVKTGEQGGVPDRLAKGFYYVRLRLILAELFHKEYNNKNFLIQQFYH